ncbi:hypothetical protein R9C00_16490 [Flammeovirgaceae bacterium SG7u.111]|nr:hypothetical protein [Flammeovirgaceae bacterium SG7u.132]WPO33301.1 hypothetical protein R9C00_16490 [Flammeovirgaceae bacterium SG7u.111]
MKNLSVIIVLVIAFGSQVFAQITGVKAYEAYVKGEPNNFHTLVKELKKSKVKTTEQKLELLKLQYGLLNSTFAKMDEDLFDDESDAAVDNAKTILEADKNNAEAKALLAGIYGFKIAYSPMKGMFLGGKSNNLLSEAMQTAPNNPVVRLMNAISAFNTPDMWGGDKKVARENFLKSIELFENQGASLENNWLLLHANAWLGQSYSEANEAKKAVETYQKVLKVAPEFDWVKHVLLPRAEKKM